MQGPRLLETTIGEIFQDIEKGKIFFFRKNMTKLQEIKAKLECVIYSDYNLQRVGSTQRERQSVEYLYTKYLKRYLLLLKFTSEYSITTSPF